MSGQGIIDGLEDAFAFMEGSAEKSNYNTHIREVMKKQANCNFCDRIIILSWVIKYAPMLRHRGLTGMQKGI